MGAEESIEKVPTKEDFEQLAEITTFNPMEIEKLWNKFEKISNSETADYQINISEFQKALGMSSRGFAERVFAAFDTDSSQQINFKEFVIGLSVMSPRSTMKEKARFCFSVFDIDRNGFIEKEELLFVLRESLGENTSVKISQTQLTKIVNATYKKMDKNGDGRIDFEEFTEEAAKNPIILSCVNVNLESLLS